MHDDAPLLTYQQAATRLGITLSTLYSLVHQRRVPHVRLGPRFVRFKPAELDAWVEAHRVDTTGADSASEQAP